jgi:hypothetical protein
MERRLKDRPEEVDKVCFFEGIFEPDFDRERQVKGA